MIRWKQVKELVIADLLQANRQTNEREKNSKVTKSNLWWRILLQNGLYLFIYGVFVGMIVFNLPLPQFPGMFTRSFGFTMLFAFMQIFQLIFNLFYDDNNQLNEYLSLPFSLSELFSSKVITILLNTVALFLLPLILMVMLGVQSGTNTVYVLFSAVLITLTLMVVMIFIPFVFVYWLHKIPFYVRYKKGITIILNVAIFLIIFLSFYSSEPSSTQETILDTVPNPLFLGFYEMLVPGRYLSGWLKFGGWLVIAGGFLLYSFWKVIPALYSDNQSGPTKRKKKESAEVLPYRSKWQVFTRYQFRQMQDTTFMMQFLFAKLYFPFIFLAPVIIDGDNMSLSFLSEFQNFWGLYFLVGALFAILMIGESSFSGVIISFDKENYHYIQSLPLSFRHYMQFKFWFAYAIEWAMGILILSILSFFMTVPIFVFLCLVVGYTLGAYVAALFFFMRDYRLLNLNWNHYTELVQRGMNQALRVFFNFILFFLLIFAVFMLSLWLLVQSLPMVTLGISVLVTLLLIAGTYGMYHYSKKNFWVKFN